MHSYQIFYSLVIFILAVVAIATRQVAAKLYRWRSLKRSDE